VSSRAVSASSALVGLHHVKIVSGTIPAISST
jgi:hypothetical protein